MAPLYSAYHTPFPGSRLVNAGDTSLSAPTKVVPLFDTSLSRALLEGVYIKAMGNTTTGVIRLWSQEASAQDVWLLEDEVLVTTVNATTSLPSFSQLWSPQGGPADIPMGRRWGVTTHNSEAFSVRPIGGYIGRGLLEPIGAIAGGDCGCHG